MFAELAMLTVLVHNGDTMSGIAASHSVSLAAVEAANPSVTDPNLIYAGSTLNIPTGTASPSSIGSIPPALTPEPQQPAPSSQGTATGIPGWATCIVQRESGGNPRSVNAVPGWVGNGGGLFGDLQSTWNNYDGYAQPFDAPVSVQVQFNDQLHAQDGLSPWAADGCPGT